MLRGLVEWLLDFRCCLLFIIEQPLAISQKLTNCFILVYCVWNYDSCMIIYHRWYKKLYVYYCSNNKKRQKMTNYLPLNRLPIPLNMFPPPLLSRKSLTSDWKRSSCSLSKLEHFLSLKMFGSDPAVVAASKSMF